jgi:hypothetical protein
VYILDPHLGPMSPVLNTISLHIAEPVYPLPIRQHEMSTESLSGNGPRAFGLARQRFAAFVAQRKTAVSRIDRKRRFIYSDCASRTVVFERVVVRAAM